MNKRQRKKLHKIFLIDVVFAVSVSPYWRKKMFQSVKDKKYFINKYHNYAIEKPLNPIIHRYNLKYSVSIIPYEEVVQVWEDFGSEQVYFKFESVEFPNLVDYSANNPDVLE